MESKYKLLKKWFLSLSFKKWIINCRRQCKNMMSDGREILRQIEYLFSQLVFQFLGPPQRVSNSLCKFHIPP